MDASAAPAAPRIDTVDEDDRRWLWIAALVLLAVEAWMRRARRTLVDQEEGSVRVA